MQIQWSVSDDCKTYTGLTTTRVYEIGLFKPNSTLCYLMARNRACPTGAHGLADSDLADWDEIGKYPNPTIAMIYAQAEENE